VDLDAQLRFEVQGQAVKDFLTTMLYKHLLPLEPDLGKMSVSEFENLLCTKLFDEDATYQELIRSSEGNPRDFLKLLGYCFGSSELDAGKPITERAVLHAAIDYFQNNKQPEIAQNPGLTEAFDRLFQLVTDKGSKLFAVSSNIAEQNEVLQALWHYRFIHLVQSRLPIFVDGGCKDYDIYAMDYGKLLSLKVTQEGAKRLKKIERITEVVLGVLSNLIGLGDALASPIALAMAHENIGGAMRKMLGRSAAAKQGVESGDFAGIERLITSGCIADQIVVSATRSYHLQHSFLQPATRLSLPLAIMAPNEAKSRPKSKRTK
jgi:hypothetical protein